jgi:hypothetical protein
MTISELHEYVNQIYYSVQYIDNKESWTAIVKMTPVRFARIISDGSISKIRLHCPDGTIFSEFEPDFR